MPRVYTGREIENAIEIAMIVGQRGFVQDAMPIIEWVMLAADEFEDEHKDVAWGETPDSRGEPRDYYIEIDDWTIARMVADRIEP